MAVIAGVAVVRLRTTVLSDAGCGIEKDVAAFRPRADLFDMASHIPWNHRRSHDSQGHAHSLTFTCYRRYKFRSAERTCLWMAEAIDRARENWDFHLYAYVFMPDHAHLIVQPRGESSTVAAILKGIKQPVGRKAFLYLEANAPRWLPRLTRARGQRVERVFWQTGGGYDRNIVESKALFASINYLHENPVRKGLIERGADWRWSSAGWFES